MNNRRVSGRQSLLNASNGVECVCGSERVGSQRHQEDILVDSMGVGVNVACRGLLESMI